MKKWKAEPLGLIKFLLFNKYPGIRSVLENDSPSLSPGTSERFRAGSWARVSSSRCLSRVALVLSRSNTSVKTDCCEVRGKMPSSDFNLISFSVVSAIFGSSSLKQTLFCPNPCFSERRISQRWKNTASMLSTRDRFSHVRFLPACTQNRENLTSSSCKSMNTWSRALGGNYTRVASERRDRDRDTTPDLFKPVFDTRKTERAWVRSCARGPTEVYATCLFSSSLLKCLDVPSLMGSGRFAIQQKKRWQRRPGCRSNLGIMIY